MKIQIAKRSVGYIWYSDQQKPEIIQADSYLLELDKTKNPFVVEGQIYSAEENVSYSIKYVDGEYFVTKYKLSDLGNDYDEKEFIPNRLKDDEGKIKVAKIKFRQYWKAQKDDLCEGMEVLVPAEYVFVGFEYNTKNKEDK